MPQRERVFGRRAVFNIVTWIALQAGIAPALGAPLVQQVSGALDHNGTVTISGRGFGSKATATPLIWDNATGKAITDKWSGAWPNLLPGYDTKYYSPMRGMDPPHSRDTRYIAGAHAANTGAYSGYAVNFFKHVSVKPSYIYASWYQRVDDHWVFSGDNNFKTFDYSQGKEPYSNYQWYIAFGANHPDSRTDTGIQWCINGQQLANPDENGHNAWFGRAVNPMAGKWSKVEIAIKVTDQKDGYVTIWENGHQVLNYAGPTDVWSGDERTISIGGYARSQGYTSNWRYFDDVYLDTTLSRVVLADKPVLSQATIIENQIPSAWSDGSITATVNLGNFSQGQAAYLFVVDASGTPSGSGLAVTAGGTVNMPTAPSKVAVH
jgi:hypothetical protein